MRQPIAVAVVAVLAAPLAFAATLGGPLPTPLPVFPATNWWNADVSAAPLDAGSGSYIQFLGGAARQAHPDFGGCADNPCLDDTYGFPYITVSGSQAKVVVDFSPGYPDESDGVGQAFYPIPVEAQATPHWIEGGAPGNQDLRDDQDRHMLIVDTDNRLLYELYNVFWNGANWEAGSGAFFDMKTNNRRPEGWTSADAAGLAIFPGLVRYDEVFGTGEIGHAFRVTVQQSNGYVFPASHNAGSTAGALPMGARLRLKSSTNISGFAPEVQKIFRAMKKYGLIVADNGSNLFVSGTFDTRWDNDVLNPAFGSLHASDFEVVQLGWRPGAAPPFGSFDTPVTGAANLQGAIPVTGWALDDVGVAKVEIWRDPVSGETPTPNGKVFIGNATFVSGARPDVQAIYPSYPQSDRAAWGYMLLTNMLPNQNNGGPVGGNGAFTLYAYLYDDYGNVVALSPKTITCNNASANKPFGTIDTPGQGATVSGTLNNFGWALTPGTPMIPTNGSTIEVHVDGNLLGTAQYNLPRSDIQTLFPGYTNTDGAIGFFSIDTTQLTNGVHTIFWIVTDDHGRSDGIGSRYFTVAN
jgi:hypothetical protein